MTDFTAYMEIIYHGEKMDYVLSAGYDIERKEYYMPSLSFYKDYGLSTEELIEGWDNDFYLIETLYNKVLMPWANDKTIIDGASFGDIIKMNGGAVNDIPSLKELIDKGIELGFFKDYYNSKENGTDTKQN